MGGMRTNRFCAALQLGSENIWGYFWGYVKKIKTDKPSVYKRLKGFYESSRPLMRSGHVVKQPAKTNIAGKSCWFFYRLMAFVQHSHKNLN